MTTCRPAGPIVHLTASASRSTPFFIPRRAASSNMICLVAIVRIPRSECLREETERRRDGEMIGRGAFHARPHLYASLALRLCLHQYPSCSYPSSASTPPADSLNQLLKR